MAPRSKSVGLNIVIAGDAKGAQKAMGQTAAGAKTLSQQVSGVAASVGGLLAGGAIVRWGKEAIDTYRSVGGELMALKRVTGGSDEFIPGLFVAAQQSGVAIDKLQTGIGILSSKIQNGAVEKLGIDVKNATGEARSFEDVLGDIMDRYAELEGTERTAFARSLFGRGGGDMMKLLGKGREEMAGFVEEAKRLGITLNSEDLQQAIDNQRDFQLALTAAKVTMGKELLPVVTQFTTTLASNMPAIATAVGSVAGAFNALPGPLQAVVGLSLALGPAIRLASVAFGPVVAGLKAIAATRALDGFRLGLMGVTSAGAGAGNAVGGFIGRVAASPAALGAAGVGLGVFVAWLVKTQQEAAAAKANIDGVVSAAQAGGLSIEESFRDRLATTLAGAEGGFDNSFGEEITAGLEALGLTAEDFFGILQAGGAEVDDLKGRFQELSDNAGSLSLADTYADAVKGIGNVYSAWVGANAQQERLTRAQGELGVSTDETTEATDRSTSAVVRYTSATKAATDAVERRKSQLDSATAAQEAVASAEEALVAAITEEGEARKAAAGDSDEHRQALEAEADAAEGLKDATDAVADAQQALRDAEGVVLERRQELNEAYKEAAERLQDLRLEARAAADAEKQAALDVLTAKAERDRILQDSQSTDLERQQAQLDYEQSLTAQAQAQAQARDAAAEAARTVEQDEGVISAKEALQGALDGVTEANGRVADAQDGVRDAIKRVEDAERNKQAVADAAAERYKEAQKTSEKAVRDVVDAQGELVGAVAGTEGQVRFLQTALLELYPEGSPQRRDIEKLVRDLSIVLSGGIGPNGSYGSVDAADRAGSRQPAAGNIPQDETRDPVGNRFRRPLSLTVIGSDVQTKREAERMLRDHSDRDARVMTGG